MQIHEFLRFARMRAGFRTYEGMAKKAEKLGYTISTQALNKNERIPQYMTPATKELYIETLALSEKEADFLDVLAAQCQVRKGSNTNPHMRVVDRRVFDNAVTESCELVIALVTSTLARKDVLSEDDQRVLTAALKGILCKPLNHNLESS